VFLAALCCWASLPIAFAQDQPASINFHKMGIAEGLHDGTVRCIGQDRYGYIWIGSVGALNRYDGKNVVHYTRITGDSTSPYGSQPRSIHSDKAGRLWIGFETGLMEYDLDKGIFKKVPGIKDQFISNIFSLNDSVLFVASRRGLIRYNTRTGDTLYFSNSQAPRHTALYKNAVYDIALRNGTLYLATGRGLVLMNLATLEARLVPIAPLGEKMIHTLALDAKGNTWIAPSSR
jgi:ligand-binding sensor domain-containing protein